LSSTNAAVLVQQFQADYLGTAFTAPAFDFIAITDGVLADAASLVAAHPLRAYDAVQLASAIRAKDVDSSLDQFCAYDQQLVSAASAEGFVIVQ
jgi:predicted nucleic acid-binding protein